MFALSSNPLTCLRLAERNNLLAAVSVTLLLPLCLLRDFAMLSYTSMLGVAGVLYTACFMVDTSRDMQQCFAAWQPEMRAADDVA